MTRTRHKTDPDKTTYFVTSSVVNWVPLFSRPEIAQIVLDSLDFMNNHKRLLIHAYVLMEDHMHLLATSENFSQEIRKLKSFTAKQIINFLHFQKQYSYYLEILRAAKQSFKNDQAYQVWQEGYHPQHIRDMDMYQNTMEYIHMNPVKRGYVDYPEHWRYSSSRSYKGEPGMINITLLNPY